MKAQLSLLLLCLCLTVKAQLPVPDHIVMVILENWSYNKIISNGGCNCPYINSLATDPYGALFTNSHAFHQIASIPAIDTFVNSQPNYFHIFSGSDQGWLYNSTPTPLPFTTPNLGASLIQNSKSFTAYSEDLPFEGYSGSAFLPYARKHNPMVNWQGTGTNGIPSTQNKPFSSFPTDFTTLPTFSYVIPNLDNDMHDGLRQTGDTWLLNNLDDYVQWAKTNNSLFILTFDEGNSIDSLHIPTIFVGEMVLGGSYSQYIDHHDVLKTIEDMYGLPYAGNSANADSIYYCWQTVLPIELVNFKAAPTIEGVELNWSTASELNNDFFTIENSRDGAEYKIVDKVIGGGTRSELKHYSYVDKNPYYGKSYYRLKQTDIDRKYSYSNVVSVDVSLKKEPSITIFPNPSAGHSFEILVQNGIGENLLIGLYDILGQVIESQWVIKSEKANTHILFTPEYELMPGTYLIKVSSEEGYIVQKVTVE